MGRPYESIITELDAVRRDARKTAKGTKYGEYLKSVMLMRAAIDRLGQPIHKAQAAKVDEQWPEVLLEDVRARFKALSAIVEAIRADYGAGRLRSLEESIHAEVFGDFLDMAQYLLEEMSLKDPAAVVGGSALEAHLHKLADKVGVIRTDSGGKPKKATVLNADLKKAGAYGGGDEKQVTAWQAIRNDAAHGDYGKYVAEQVRLLIAGVRDFIARNPA